MDAQVPPASESAELHTEPSEAPFGKCDGRGKLVFQELYQDGFPAEWHYTLTYYPHGSSDGVKLQRDVSAINVFLAAEIRRLKTVHTFIKEHLVFFLENNLCESAETITLKDIDDGQGSNPGGVHPPPTAAERARLRAKLRPYACSKDQPVVMGNGWTVDINVLTHRGAVEHWLVKGRVTPLQIDSFLCEPKEPDRTFHPNVLVR